MAGDHGNESEASTRRDLLKMGGGAVIGAGLLAGCTGESSPGKTDSSNVSGTRNDSTDGGDGSPANASNAGVSSGGSYTATMAPMGELTLDEPPSTWVGGLGFAADVLTALGHADGAVGMADPRFWYTGFYDFLDGVTAPVPDELTPFTTEDRDTDLEVLYELDPDLLAADPNPLITIYGLEKREAKEIQENIAPWFGNESRRKRVDGWSHWPAGKAYPYLSLPEYISKYAALFGEEKRSDALLKLYEPFIEDIRSRVPSKSERRSLALVNGRYNPENRDGWVIYNPKSKVEKTWGKKQSVVPN